MIIQNTHNGSKIEGLAILDDQSNVTYITKDAAKQLKTLDAQTTHIKNNLSTMQGVKLRHWPRVSGLTVSHLKNCTTIPLPPDLVYEQVPQNLDEIPNPETINTIPGLEYLANKFPKKQAWPTIALIGRDCPSAQTQQQFLGSAKDSPIVAETPLGWTPHATGTQCR